MLKTSNTSIYFQDSLAKWKRQLFDFLSYYTIGADSNYWLVTQKSQKN